MSESVERFLAHRELRLQAWARAEAAAVSDEDLEDLDPFELRDDLAGCRADGQPVTAALLQATLDRLIAWQASRLRPPRSRGKAQR